MSNNLPTPSPQLESGATPSRDNEGHAVESSSEVTTDTQDTMVDTEATVAGKPALIADETAANDEPEKKATVDEDGNEVADVDNVVAWTAQAQVEAIQQVIAEMQQAGQETNLQDIIDVGGGNN